MPPIPPSQDANETALLIGIATDEVNRADRHLVKSQETYRRSLTMRDALSGALAAYRATLARDAKS